MDNRNKYYLDTDSSALTKWAILIPTLHLCVGLFFYWTYQRQYFEIGTFKTLVSAYYFMTTFFLLIGYYRQLRDLRIFIIWTIIGLGQLLAYYLTKDIAEFKMFRGTSVDMLRSQIIMLTIFQICRQISLALTKDEFIVTYKRFSKHDEDDGRKITWVDTVLSMTVYLVTIFGNVV
jgi:ABC-type transport system involved in cytochrome c biogenesis permease subunit